MNCHRVVSADNSILSANHSSQRLLRSTSIASSLPGYLPYHQHSGILHNGLDAPIPSIYLRDSSSNILTEAHYPSLMPAGYYWSRSQLTYPCPDSHYDQNYENQSGENKEDGAKKRRSPSVAQRRAANIRERRRMLNLNEAFDVLRRRVPTFNYERRLSRIETLRLAMGYISFMTQILNGKDPQEAKINFMKPVVSVKKEKELQENIEKYD